MLKKEEKKKNTKKYTARKVIVVNDTKQTKWLNWGFGFYKLPINEVMRKDHRILLNNLFSCSFSFVFLSFYLFGQLWLFWLPHCLKLLWCCWDHDFRLCLLCFSTFIDSWLPKKHNTAQSKDFWRNESENVQKGCKAAPVFLRVCGGKAALLLVAWQRSTGTVGQIIPGGCGNKQTWSVGLRQSQ